MTVSEDLQAKASFRVCLDSMKEDIIALDRSLAEGRLESALAYANSMKGRAYYSFEHMQNWLNSMRPEGMGEEEGVFR